MVSPRRTGRRAALTKKRVAAVRNAEPMVVRYHQGPGAADGPLGHILRIEEDQPHHRPIRATRRLVRENVVGGGAAKGAAPKKVATERAGRPAEETPTRATGTTTRAVVTVVAVAPTNRTAAAIVDARGVPGPIVAVTMVRRRSRRDLGLIPDRDRGRGPSRATSYVLDLIRALVHGRGLTPSLAADVIAIVMEELHSATVSRERDTPPAIATVTTVRAEVEAEAEAEAEAELVEREKGADITPETATGEEPAERTVSAAATATVHGLGVGIADMEEKGAGVAQPSQSPATTRMR